MDGLQTSTGVSLVAAVTALVVASGMGLVFGDSAARSLGVAAPIAIGIGIGFYLFADLDA